MIRCLIVTGDCTWVDIAVVYVTESVSTCDDIGTISVVFVILSWSADRAIGMKTVAAAKSTIK